MGGDLAAIVMELVFRVSDLERRDRNRSRIGTISEVDAARGLARVELSREGGTPYLTGWIPWREQAAGAAKTHFPPSAGQQVRVESQSGDLTDGEIEIGMPSEDNPRPSTKGDEVVLLTHGELRISSSDGGAKLTISLGGSSIEVTKDKITTTATDVAIDGKTAITGEVLTHNEKNISHDHVHTDVVRGSQLTGPPA